MNKFILTLTIIFAFTVSNAQNPKGFPFKLPEEKPNRPLSAAMERNYDAYMAPRPEDNELYSQFKYTELKGFYYK